MVGGPGGGSFGMDAVLGGASSVTTSLSTLTGSATLVYQIDRTNGVVTITFVDISTASGLGTLTSSLKAIRSSRRTAFRRRTERWLRTCSSTTPARLPRASE